MAYTCAMSVRGCGNLNYPEQHHDIEIVFLCVLTAVILLCILWVDR